MTKTLKDSHVFNNLVVSDKLRSSLKKINVLRDRVPSVDLDADLAVIEKRATYPLKVAILEALQAGHICPVLNPDLGLPKYLNVLPFRDVDGKKKVIADFTKYASSKRISPAVNTTFGILQNALISYKLDTDWDLYTSNAVLMVDSAVVYSRLATKVLDKLYSVNLDPFESDFISFILAKFFLLTVAGKPNSRLIDEAAHVACFNQTSLKLIKEREEDYDTDLLYESIITLFSSLNQSPRYNIKFRSFFENYVRMYGETTIMAIDYLPGFYHMIMSTVTASGIVKEFAVENVIGRQTLTKIYATFSRL